VAIAAWADLHQSSRTRSPWGRSLIESLVGDPMPRISLASGVGGRFSYSIVHNILQVNYKATIFVVRVFLRLPSMRPALFTQRYKRRVSLLIIRRALHCGPTAVGESEREGNPVAAAEFGRAWYDCRLISGHAVSGEAYDAGSKRLS
jgi:hypothetical protein